MYMNVGSVEEVVIPCCIFYTNSLDSPAAKKKTFHIFSTCLFLSCLLGPKYTYTQAILSLPRPIPTIQDYPGSFQAYPTFFRPIL